MSVLGATNLPPALSRAADLLSLLTILSDPAGLKKAKDELTELKDTAIAAYEKLAERQAEVAKDSGALAEKIATHETAANALVAATATLDSQRQTLEAERVQQQAQLDATKRANEVRASQIADAAAKLEQQKVDLAAQVAQHTKDAAALQSRVSEQDAREQRLTAREQQLAELSNRLDQRASKFQAAIAAE